MSAWISTLLGSLLILLVRLYQLLAAPLLPPVCRFYPSCSRYSVGVIRKHGPWIGVWLTARRLLRCHPLHPGGYDPVPEHWKNPPPVHP